VAELSILYNVHFGQWIGLHHDEARAAIVLRTAERLTGPWTTGQVVVSGAEFPGLYGGFLHPDSASGPTIYYAMSQWAPYNVYLMRTTLA
jgi:D-arabinan endo alpha-(1,5)-arabinofuranosidase